MSTYIVRIVVRDDTNKDRHDVARALRQTARKEFALGLEFANATLDAEFGVQNIEVSEVVE